MYACADHCADAVQLSGKRAVNVQSVLDHYDPTGNSIRLIGAKIFLLLKEKRKYVHSVPGALCHVCFRGSWFLQPRVPWHKYTKIRPLMSRPFGMQWYPSPSCGASSVL